ncbi:MAG: hypothetical protein ACFB11_16550 [Paracoccaceae bacterium]|mgnify:CR=1 FL=1
MIRPTKAALAFGIGMVIASPVRADYKLDLVETGLREYYCTITVMLTNNSDQPLTEINGYFLSYVGDMQVGRSKGNSFLNMEPGGSTEAIFETPNAPCDDVTRYDFVIGACRIGSGFEDRSVCLNRIDLETPFGTATGL